MTKMGFRREQSIGLVTNAHRAEVIRLIAPKHGITVIKDNEEEGHPIRPGNMSLTLRYNGRVRTQAFWEEVDNLSPLQPPE